MNKKHEQTHPEEAHGLQISTQKAIEYKTN